MSSASKKRLRLTSTVLVLLLLCVAVAASATIYDYFYGSVTGTVRTPDVTLAAGGDASGSCSAYPCATVSISSTSDTATVSLSLFKADTSLSPYIPSSYYTNLVQVKDANNAHTILGVTITSVSSTSASDFGDVVVYYCTTQCTFGSNDVVSGGTEIGSFSITSTAGGTISGFGTGISISAGSTHYIEMVAYAGSSATAGDTITFKVAVQWV